MQTLAEAIYNILSSATDNQGRPLMPSAVRMAILDAILLASNRHADEQIYAQALSANPEGETDETA